MLTTAFQSFTVLCWCFSKRLRKERRGDIFHSGSLHASAFVRLAILIADGYHGLVGQLHRRLVGM